MNKRLTGSAFGYSASSTSEPSSCDSVKTAAPAPLAPTELKSIVEAGYDAIAPKYLAWSAPRPTTTRAGYVAQLLDLLPPGASVLELGCGVSALVGLVLAPAVASYVLTDQPYVARLVERNISENLAVPAPAPDAR